MSDIGLYFPYVNLPDDTWVKAAALHWPQLGRFHPLRYYGLKDSDVVKRLQDELDFVVDVKPDWAPGRQSWVGDDVLERVHPLRRSWGPSSTQDQINALFFDFLDRHKDELIPRYGTEALGIESFHTGNVYDELLPLDDRLEKVHSGKLSYQLARRLAHDGLLVSRNYRWHRASDGKILHISDLGMHRRLAGVYLATLADVTARENGMTPVTDQALFHPVTSGWTIEAMAQILLADDTGHLAQGEADYSQVFAVLALQTVLPRDLDEVPVERIIEARRRLLPELMSYRAFLDSLTPDFIAISEVRDPEVRSAKLRNHVESKIAQPIETMERELGRLGMQPVRAVLTLQTLAPPTALGILANAVDLPSLVTGAGVVAGCLVGATNSALDQRRQTLAGHPTGYLLNLRSELSPSDTVAQIRSVMRRANPRRSRWR
ncbi:DUF6236 family protein [Nocardiopsis sp. ARC36]